MNIEIRESIAWVLTGVELLFIIYEHLIHRGFKNKVKGWHACVNGIAHTCTSLEKDCEGDKIRSVAAAGAAVKMIALQAHTLDASMKAAVERPTLLKRLIREN